MPGACPQSPALPLLTGRPSYLHFLQLLNRDTDSTPSRGLGELNESMHQAHLVLTYMSTVAVFERRDMS